MNCGVGYNGGRENETYIVGFPLLCAGELRTQGGGCYTGNGEG